MLMLPAPAQSAVPPFSKVRLVNDTPLALARVRAAPGTMTVRPLPLIVPPVQFITLPTVTVLLPPRVPLLKKTLAGETLPVPLKLAVADEMASVLFVQI